MSTYRHFYHTHQEATSRIQPFYGNMGTVQQIFRPRFLSEDVGMLFEYITSVIDYAKRPLVSYLDFTLVNLYARYDKFSHGYCPPPPSETIYPATSLVLTFALHRRYYDEVGRTTKSTVFVKSSEDPVYATKRYKVWNKKFRVMYPKWTYAWGQDLYRIEDMFTISVPMGVVRKCKMRAMQMNNTHYLYNALSALTKCWITNQYAHPFLNNMFSNYSLFYNMPLPDLLNRHTVDHLLYNKYVWFHATNLITRKITYNVALFYFMYIHGDLPISERAEGDLLTQILFANTDSIESLLIQSIIDYNTNRSEENLILMAALYGKNCNESDYHARLIDLHYSSNLILEPEHAKLIILEALTASTLEESTL